MLALTVYQPWATFLVSGVKINETRTRPTRVRGWIAIHAGKQMPRMAFHATALRTLQDEEQYPRGAFLGLVHVSGCERSEDIIDQVSRKEQALGDYNPGRHIILIDQRIPLVQPIPASGKQGWWPVTPSQLRTIGAYLRQGGQMTTDLAVSIAGQPYHAKGE